MILRPAAVPGRISTARTQRGFGYVERRPAASTTDPGSRRGMVYGSDLMIRSGWPN